MAADSRLPPALAAEREELSRLISVFVQAWKDVQSSEAAIPELHSARDAVKAKADALFQRLAETERQREEARAEAQQLRGFALDPTRQLTSWRFPWERPTGEGRKDG